MESTVTAEGQTTLPKAVRDALGLGPGDRVRYHVRDGEVRLLRVQILWGRRTPRSVRLRGIL